MAFEWKDEFSVGIKEIDDQHKSLIQISERLYQGLYEDMDEGELNSILKELLGFAKTHFETEEKYFDMYGFNDAENHKKEHKLFEQKLKSLFGVGNDQHIEASFELIDFLEDWLLDHMQTKDQEYVKCFEEHGLK